MSEEQIHDVETEFAKHDYAMNEESLFVLLKKFGCTYSAIFSILGKIGIGARDAVKLSARLQRKQTASNAKYFSLRITD
ncbi:MAG: hypothetical protein ABIH99_04680 [Candidatus Micrarchaeota archaeon]